MRMLALCVISLALPLFADTVKTVDGRELKGDVTEDGDKVIVKMKIGSITLKKSEVKEIVRDAGGATGAATGAGTGSGRADTYKSYLLGYVLHVPSPRYLMQRVPPEPLRDVILYDSGNECTVSLGICPLEDVPDPITADAAKKLADSFRQGMSIYYSSLTVLSADASHIGAYDTAHFVLEGERRDSKRREHLVETVFRLHGKIMSLDGEGIVGKHKDMDADTKKIVETLEEFEPKEMDGKTQVDMKGCCAMDVLDGWEVSPIKETDEAGTFGATRKDPLCVANGTWLLTHEKLDMRSVADGFVGSLKKNHPNAEVSASKVANIKGKVAWEIRFKHMDMPDVKEPLQGRAVLFRTVDRVYTVTLLAGESLGDKFDAATGPVFDSFQIFPDLLSKGSLETGREAMKAMVEGDAKDASGNTSGALPFYDKAIDLYPPFAKAYNNRGLALAKTNDFDKGYKDLQEAGALAPDDYFISRNMAYARISNAAKSLDEGRITAAVDEAEKVKARAKDDPQLSDALGEFYFAVGMHYYNDKKFGAAKAFFKKGLDFYHDKDAIKKDLAIICENEGVDEANKSNWRAAKSKFEEALKYDPSNSQARQLLDRVNQELSK